MTSPRLATTGAGGRFYRHPTTKRKYTSVTTILGALPKPFLTSWAAKATAEWAVEHIGEVTSLAMRDRQAAIDLVKGATRRQTAHASEIGSAVHAEVERMLRGGERRRAHPEVEPFLVSYDRFVEHWKPKPLELEGGHQSVELTVWNHAHEYAGSLDSILEIDGEKILVDVKTGKGVYPETSLQLCAYARAESITLDDDTEIDMLAVDGAAILHIRPDGYELIPAAIHDEVWQVFRHVHAVHTWGLELSKTVLGRPLG